MIHHELPGEVITCNIHPMQRKNKAVITFVFFKNEGHTANVLSYALHA